MTTERVSGWISHGESAQSALIAGLLPSRGIHFLVAEDKEAARAIVADLAVAVAGGMTAGGLSEPDAKGRRHAMASFFNLSVGEVKGVAIIGATDLRSVTAAALARGVTSKLPIVISAARQTDIVSTQLHRMRREKEGGVGLAIISADFSNAADIQRVADYRGSDYALLVVTAQEPPAGLVEPDTHIVRVGADFIELVQPESVNSWRRTFTLETIKLHGGEAQVIRPNLNEPAGAPIFIIRAEPKPAPTPAPKIAQHLIFALGGAPLAEAERTRWPAGAIFVRAISETVEAVRAVDGVTEITVVANHRGNAVREEVARVETALASASLGKRARVVVSDVQLLNPFTTAG